MVTKDEARWALVGTTKEYVAAQKELRAMEISPEDIIGNLPQPNMGPEPILLIRRVFL